MGVGCEGIYERERERKSPPMEEASSAVDLFGSKKIAFFVCSAIKATSNFFVGMTPFGHTSTIDHTVTLCRYRLRRRVPARLVSRSKKVVVDIAMTDRFNDRYHTMLQLFD